MKAKDFKTAVKLLGRLAYWPIGDPHIVVHDGAMMAYSYGQVLAEYHGAPQGLTTAYPIKTLKKIAAKAKGDVRLYEDSIVAGGVTYDMGPPPADLDDAPELTTERPTTARYTVRGDLPFHRALHAASKDEGRPHLNCLCLEVDNGRAYTLATDGHRLAYPSVPCEGEPATLLIPYAAAELLVALKGPYAVAWDARSGVVLTGAWRVYVWQPDAKFPPWRKVVPESENIIIQINLKALTAAVKAVDMGSPGESEKDGKYPSRVLLEVEDELLVTWEDTARIHKAQTGVSCAVEGEHRDPVIMLRTEYLLDALKNARVDELVFSSDAPTARNPEPKLCRCIVGGDQLVMGMLR